ncbi:MAG: hypothetical protein AB8G99_15240 [Planctomycetaceae bacterium]
MSASLLNPLAELRRSLRRVAIVRGLALTFACLLGSVVLAGTIDWFLRTDETPLRMFLSGGTCVAVLYVVWATICRPLFSRLTDLQLAQRVERAYPEMQGRLSSSVEFTANESGGSRELRDSVVSQATRDIAVLNVDSLPDRQPFKRAMSAVALAVVVGAFAFLAKPVEASTAVQRLIFPLRSIPWPSTTNLRIIEEDGTPLKQDEGLTIAQGEFREVLIQNTLGQLPENARLEYRLTRRGKPRFEPLRGINLASVTRGEVGRAVLSAGTEKIYFRALGRDHETRWYWLSVVAPPKLTSIEITVRPPAYTGQEPKVLDSGKTSIEAIVGSTVDVKAVADRPLETATLMVEGRPIDANLDDRNRSLSTSFEVNNSGVSSWWVGLVAEDGTEDPRPTQYELRAVQDEPPSVFIENPPYDQQVTVQASIPITVVATDDLEVVSLSLTGQLNDTAAAYVFAFEGAEDRREQTGSTTLDLSKLEATPGDRLTLRATANDAFDGQPPHTTTSEPRTLLIVTDEVKRAGLAEQYTDLLNGLKEVADSQIGLQDQFSELLIQQEEAGLRRSDLTQLKRIEIDQNRITARLFDADDGLNKRVQSVVDQFANNKIESPAMQTQLADVQDEFNHLQTDVLPPLLSELTSARKAAEESFTEDSANVNAEGLADVERLQQEVATSLASLLQDAETWKRTVDVQSALAEISTQQAGLNRETAALGDRVLADNTLDQKQQSADQSRLARRQQRIAEQLEDLIDAVTVASDSLPEDDPARDRLNSGKRFTQQSALPLQLREASRNLKDGRIGAAGNLQAKASQALRELAAIFEGPQVTSEESRLESLTEVEEALDELVRQQGEVQKKLRQNDESALAQQQDIRNQTDRQQRRLDRLGASEASEAVAKASVLMGDAEELIAANDPSAAAKAQAAEQALQNALETTRQEQQEVKQQSEQLGLANAVNELRGLIERQKRLLKETQESQTAVEASGRRTRRQSRAILEVAKQQARLANETTTASDTMRSSAVLALVTESAADHMRRAEALLRKRMTSRQTTSLQQLALRELTDVVAAVFPDEQNAMPASSEKPANTASEQEPQQNGLVSIQARLSLLKTLQLSINERTQSLAGLSDEAASSETESLFARQQRLATLAAELLKEFQELQQ